MTCYLAGGLLSLSTGLPAWAGDDPRVTIQPSPWPELATRMARMATLSPFMVQAQNGLLLDQTLWNHHFALDEPSVKEDAKKPKPGAELSFSGMAVLDRLARRYLDSGCCMQLYLQTGRDLTAENELDQFHENPNQVARERAELDQKRLLTIGAYLAANWPGVPAMVYIHDPNVPRMIGIECVQAVQEMWKEARGMIPNEIQGGLSISPQKLTASALASGPPPIPSPASPGTGGVSALGSGADSGGP